MVAVVVIFGLVLSGVLVSEAGRAVALILCLALLTQSWFMQRRYARNRERLVFLTLALCLPALASIWLEFNVVRFYPTTATPQRRPTQRWFASKEEFRAWLLLSHWLLASGRLSKSAVCLLSEYPTDLQGAGGRGGTGALRELGFGLVQSGLPFRL